MERMLVDDHHAVAGLGDQITVMDLDGLEQRCRRLAIDGDRRWSASRVRQVPASIGRCDRRPPSGPSRPSVRGRPRRDRSASIAGGAERRWPSAAIAVPAVVPAENSSNASPGPTGNPSGSDCAQGGGAGWPNDSGNTRPGAARLEPGGDRLPVGRAAGQIEAPQTAPAPGELAAGGRSLLERRRRGCAATTGADSRRRPAPGSLAAASAGRSSKTSAAGSRAGGCRPAASRGTGPRPWSGGR